jgi:hypothetical protein
LGENVSAINELRQQLALVKPDIVFGVENGGSFLLEVLADPGKPMPEHFMVVEKGEHGERTIQLKDEMRKAIVDGKKTFAIIDSYMGGHAAGAFINMFDGLVKETGATDVHLELLWVREQHGYERINVEAKPGTPERIVLQPHTLPPEHLTKVEPKDRIPGQAKSQVGQTTREVRFILGDDMTLVYAKDAKAPIRIFDAHGNIVKVINVGVVHPDTGAVLTSTREILKALMQGTIFP